MEVCERKRNPFLGNSLAGTTAQRNVIMGVYGGINITNLKNTTINAFHLVLYNIILLQLQDRFLCSFLLSNLPSFYTKIFMNTVLTLGATHITVLCSLKVHNKINGC